MVIMVNGSPLALEVKEGSSLGELLSGADELLDSEGSVIVSLKVEGEEIDAESYSRIAGRQAASVTSVEIQAEDSSALRIRAIETLLELLDIARRHAEDAAAHGTATDWQGLRAGARDMRDAFAGLFAADELSFVQLFTDILERAGDEPDKAGRAEVSAQAERLTALFGERQAELRSPAGEMRTAGTLFEAKAPELAELPVLLQTGKEDQAMKAILYFIEIFNKVIRIIPELRKRGVDTGSISVEGKGMPEFYGSFNQVLRELTEAFEHKDAVLIGDLAEYEVLPRMRSFFAAMREALPES
jgi:hypothetical protein